MSLDLREQLQQTLAGRFVLERELGGGGMSRVFVATETALDRKIVIKVLAPELAYGISVDRFKREIQLAAQLQHPHVVGVLIAGETEGLPYYTMPFVDGRSLRERLNTSGALPIPETISILRDVAKALAYAHACGVVHRDIKPDNVLITSGSAAVADFGIAKALAAARTEPGAQTLTQIGTSIGTPAYMAPEQAAADPDADHRADIYSFGVMAYEMLAGTPPFQGRSPHQLLAAQMAEAPLPIRDRRPDTPSMIADMVMRCLAKAPNDRPQRADDLVRTLETTSGAGHPVMPAHPERWPAPATALGVWAAAFLAVASAARAATVWVGLPGWVLPGTMLVMALGLPAVVFTHLVHRRARLARAEGAITPGGSVGTHSTLTRFAIEASSRVSWRRTALGGVYALGAFLLVVVAYMVLRSLGIGPDGSLFAKGTLRTKERIVVADFRSTGDTALGPVVTEAFRTGLAQSQGIVVLPATAVRDVLRRMQRDPNAAVDLTLARELATREGMKAFIEGDVLSIGGRYALGVRLVETQTGKSLVSLQERVDSERDLLAAIDRLATRLRERTGESLRDIREALPLEQVTTPSLAALRKYVQGTRALSFDGDFARGAALLEEAVALDTGFAMAYRKLAVEYNNRGGREDRVVQLISQAYRHRDRLSDAERFLMLAGYYQFGPQQDLLKTIAAYESLAELQPDNWTALNNLAAMYQFAHDYPHAQTAIVRALTMPEPAPVVFTNLGTIGVALGDTAQVRRAIRAMATKFATNPYATLQRVRLLNALGQRDSAASLATEVLRSAKSDPASRASAARTLGEFALMEGRLADARRLFADFWRMQGELGAPAAPLEAGLGEAWLDGWARGDTMRARATLERTLSAHPLAAVPNANRPYERAVAVLTLVGRIAQARDVVLLLERARAVRARSVDRRLRHTMLGDIAIAERRYDDAVREYRDGDVFNPCMVCMQPRVARAFDLAGQSDSAIAALRRYVDTPDAFRATGPIFVGVDADDLAGAYKRLGELLEARGDRQRARSYYLKFAELWKRADPELQPKVAEVQKRIAGLTDAGAR